MGDRRTSGAVRAGAAPGPSDELAMGQAGGALTPRAYLQAIEGESAALAGGGRAAPDAAVRSCPGWSVTDVVRHVGSVHRRATAMVTERSARELPFSVVDPAPSGPAPLVAWFEEGAGALLDALRSAGTGAPVWNWTDGPQVARFWFRRMAHETAVHRWDVAAAAGAAEPVGAEVALDGIEELFELFLPEAISGLPDEGLGGSLCLSRSDGPGEWVVRLAPGSAEVTRGAAAATATVSGSGSDLLLFVWNRLPAGRLRVEGSRAVAEAWSRLLRW